MKRKIVEKKRNSFEKLEQQLNMRKSGGKSDLYPFLVFNSFANVGARGISDLKL